MLHVVEIMSAAHLMTSSFTAALLKMIPLTAPISPHFPRASLLYFSHLTFTSPCTFLSPPPQHLRRRRGMSAMAIGDSPAPLPQLAPNSLPLELKEESDFDQIVSSDGLVSVCGFGSLLSGSCKQPVR